MCYNPTIKPQGSLYRFYPVDFLIVILNFRQNVFEKFRVSRSSILEEPPLDGKGTLDFEKLLHTRFVIKSTNG